MPTAAHRCLCQLLVFHLAVAMPAFSQAVSQQTVEGSVAPAEAEQEPLETTAAEANTSGDGRPMPPASAAESDPPAATLPDEIPLRQFVVLPRVDRPGRRVLHQDPIDAALAAGTWRPPQPGDVVTSATGEQVAWEIAVADAQGRLSGPATAGGYAYSTVASRERRVMLLDATRYVAVCLNGDWLAGDLRGAGGPQLPIELVEGENTLLFHVTSPGFRATLKASQAEVTFEAGDATLPDLVAGETMRPWVAVPVVNATTQRVVGAEVRVAIGETESVARLPSIEPLTVFKASIRLPEVTPSRGGAGEPVTARLALHLPRPDTGGVSPDPATTAELSLRVVDAESRHTRTFVSRIDSSVQPYSVVPAKGGPATGGPATGDKGDKPGVILALHDIGQGHTDLAQQFAPKPWAHVVAPHNRGEVGFVWENWGAADAMEALADATKRLGADPRRVSVTGFGYGGYGAWRLAIRYPDKFAAVGPSGAKAEFLSAPKQPTKDPTPIGSLLARGGVSRAPAGQLRNLSTVGVYLLHGAEDSRFPPAESRFVRSRLGAFHPDFVYYERPGAGYRDGLASADWPEMTRFFRDRRVPNPEDVARVDFTTAQPSEASECHWAAIELQQTPFEPSRVTIDQDVQSRAFTGRTENVRVLRLDVSHLPSGRPVTITLDGSQTLRPRRPGRSGRLWLERSEGGDWKVAGRPPAGEKSPRRAGLLKSVFGDRALLVYGTKGTPEENRWAESKARYDAQSFWRRGGGALQVLPDTAFDATRQPNRSVVLYGNAQTNAAWPSLLSTSPLQCRRGRIDTSVQSNVRPELGDDLALVMVRPRPGSATASVGVIGGTGLDGMRLTDRMRYFVPGVAYPDLLIFGPDALTEGVPGVRAAGYFARDWGVTGGDLQWRDLAL